ncbi:hypothetical protein V3390_09385 [Luteimonas sp. FXH3W]|uniref:Uncharacterized protein n=1 Tax=Aquilutibacter rugosus TaxID=3115820 RepID=A0ABU7V0X8_9GAMM
MTDIPQPGSVWVDKDDPKIEAVVLWADEKTVVYDYSVPANDSDRHVRSTPMFVKYYTPKPRTITVAGVELPEPMREALKDGERYWLTDITEERGVYKNTWTDHPIHLHNLKRGGVFRTKEDAQAWFEFEVRQRGGEV